MQNGTLKTKHTFLNMGPSHPAMHGTIQLRLELDGERVVKADVEIGYLHRAFEKHAEESTYNQVIPYTDRLNYVSPLINNMGYALAVERLLGIETTERCNYIRVIMSELSRITDHLTCIAASAMELGAMTVFLYFMEARELLYELIEDVTGGRITISYARIGGVKADLPEGFAVKTGQAFEKIRQILDEVDRLLTRNRIFIDRMRDIGVISQEDAIAYGITGPFLRSTGVEYDVRRAHPYFVYDRFDFKIPVGVNGDNYDRYLVRMEEMRQSLYIVEQALDGIPAGPISVDERGKPIPPDLMVDEGKMGRIEGIARAEVALSPNLQGAEKSRYLAVNAPDRRVILPPKKDTYSSIEGLMNHFKLVMYGHGIRPPKGEVYQPVEGANGELGFYVVSDGTDKPYRVHVRAPCFPIMAALAKILEGCMIADIIPTFGSVNMIGGELDR